MVSKLEVTDEFLSHLLVDAHEKSMEATRNGFPDTEAQILRELVCAFRSGRDGKIPAFWVERLKKFQQASD